MRGKRVIPIGVAMAATVLVAVGCAQPPQGQIDAAKKALTDAQAAEAAIYADDELVQAQDAMKQLDAELKLQQEKYAMLRSYDRATELASGVQAAGERAVAAAATNKEQVRQDALATIEQAKTMLVDVRAMLAKAPTGKGTQADLAALRSDLDGVQLAMAEADASYASGQYRDAETTASAALASAEGVKSALEAAIRARGSARARR